MTREPESTLDELSREECLELVACHSVGRLAVAVPGEPPHVVPINYVLDVDVVVFRSDPGLKVESARRSPVSFQVDYFDPFSHTGWSVLIQGSAINVESAEVAHLDLESWASGPKPHWMRVVPERISGRRIRLAEWIPDLRGYL
jgi:nitroimidazol reductase NimA-like FMN-containing flavoprotein (pyridoxamine 5'-phosphate oxidase superfamily)